LTHQPPDTAVPDVQADLLQLFRHPWPTIAAKAETRLLLDVSLRHQSRSVFFDKLEASRSLQAIPCRAAPSWLLAREELGGLS
jgi:hypothetical protein